MKLLFLVSLFAAFLISILFSNTKIGSFVLGLATFNTDKLGEITIEKVFDDKELDLPADKTNVILATGDVLLARSINAKNTSSGNFNWPFEKTSDLLNSADISFINLETPITENCLSTHRGMRFCGDPKNLEGLLFAGVDVVNIANNHMYDHGNQGHIQTHSHLVENNFLVAGFNGPVYKKSKNIKFAFLGFNAVTNQKDASQDLKEKIINEISLAQKNSDVVIVQFHWGNEYTTKITDLQKGLAHLAIDSGADLIIGNHPHWVQPVEIYRNKVIAYSHGNLVFDQEWSTKTKQGVVGKYIFYKDKLVDVKFIPILIENFGQPRILDGEIKQNILSDMKNESLKLTEENKVP